MAADAEIGEGTEKHYAKGKALRQTYFGDFPGHDEERILPGIHILLVIFLSALLFLNSIHNSFVFEDLENIVNNPEIRNLIDVPQLFGFPERDGKPGPLGDISLALNYWAGGSQPVGYHIVNMAVHAASSVLVYLIAFSLFQNRTVSLFSSLLFAAHPVHTEAVTYISGRWVLLSSFLYLLAFYSFLRYRRKRKVQRLMGSWISFLLSIFTHFSAATFPLMVLAYDVIKRLRFYREKRHAPIGREVLGKLGESVRLYWVDYLLYGSVWAIYLLYRIYLTSVQSGTAQQFATVGGHVATSARVAVHYLQLLLFPLKLVADYSYNAFPASDSAYDPWGLLSYAILISIIFLLYRGLRRYRFLVFPGAWLMIGLLPVLLLLSAEPMMAERFLYLPSVGFSLMAGLALGYYLLRRGPLGYILVVAVILLCSYRTLNRNVDWRDPLTLWAKTVEDSPQNARAHSNLGYYYALDGRLSDSLPEHRKAIEIKPDEPSFYFKMAFTYERGGLLDSAIQAYKDVLRLDPKFPLAHNNLALIYLKKKELKEAVTHLGREIELNPEAAEPHTNLGLIYERSNMLSMALLAYRKAVEEDPDSAEARFNLANLLARQGKMDKAIAEYRKALVLKPDFSRARSNLGDALTKEGDLEGAMEEYRKALSLDDTMAQTHSNLGNIYVRMGQPEKAIEEYRRAVEIMPNHISYRLNLGSALELKGELDEAVSIYEEIVAMVPDLAIVYTFLGRAYAAKGMTDKAIEAYENFTEKWKGDAKYVEAIRQRVMELESRESSP